MVRGKRRAPDRGTAAVEAALVLPLLFMIIFGIIDFGRMLNAQITVSEAAREAARAASLGESPSARANLAAANLGTVSTSVVQSCNTSDDAVINVSYEFSFVFAFGNGPVTLSSRGVMPCRS